MPGMTIEKAIEILQKARNRNFPSNPKDFDDASTLGIEALKRVGHTRHEAPEFVIPLLPGETKD